MRIESEERFEAYDKLESFV